MKILSKTSIPVILILLSVIFPFFAGPYQQSIAKTVIIYMILALSWNMLLKSGQISFGLAGFFGIGTYASVLLSIKMGIPPLLTIVIGGIITGLIAAALGLIILRLRAMYFAITTLALGEIFRVIIHNMPNFAGGAHGLILPSVIFEGNGLLTYWLFLVIALFSIGLSFYFDRSKIHLALTAIRDNEITAKVRGIDIFKYLLLVFTITAGMQGLAGGLYAHSFGFVTPESSFSSDFILLPIAMALLGGIYTTSGPVVGAIVLGVLSEYLKLYIPYGHLVVYGLIVVVVILFMPNGIIGLYRNTVKKVVQLNE